MRNSASGLSNNSIGGKFTQARADIAGRHAQALGNFLCRESIGAGLQDLENPVREYRRHRFPRSGAKPDNDRHSQVGIRQRPSARKAAAKNNPSCR